MQGVTTAVPFLVLAGILVLILASAVRARGGLPRPARPRRRPEPKLTLHVNRDRMDEDLKELIRRS